MELVIFLIRWWWIVSFHIIGGCIRKFPDWVDNEVYGYFRYYSLRSNTKGYDSQNSDTTASSGRELYHLQFSLQETNPETFGYILVHSKGLTGLQKRWSPPGLPSNVYQGAFNPGIRWTTHIHLVPMLRMCRAIPPLSNISSWCDAHWSKIIPALLKS